MPSFTFNEGSCRVCFILKRNKITKAKDERNYLSSVRFEPGTTMSEILNLAKPSNHHDHGFRLVPSHEKLGTYYQNLQFF